MRMMNGTLSQAHAWPCACPRCRFSLQKYCSLCPTRSLRRGWWRTLQWGIWNARWHSHNKFVMSTRTMRTHIHAIKVLSNRSSISCVLDSGANRLIFNNETWLEGTNTLTPTTTPINGISGSITETHQCGIGRHAMHSIEFRIQCVNCVLWRS